MIISDALVLARVINYAPRVMLHIMASQTDDFRGIIYDGSMFIVERLIIRRSYQVSTCLTQHIRLG